MFAQQVHRFHLLTVLILVAILSSCASNITRSAPNSGQNLNKSSGSDVDFQKNSDGRAYSIRLKNFRSNNIANEIYNEEFINIKSLISLYSMPTEEIAIFDAGTKSCAQLYVVVYMSHDGVDAGSFHEGDCSTKYGFRTEYDGLVATEVDSDRPKMFFYKQGRYQYLRTRTPVQLEPAPTVDTTSAPPSADGMPSSKESFIDAEKKRFVEYGLREATKATIACILQGSKTESRGKCIVKKWLIGMATDFGKDAVQQYVCKNPNYVDSLIGGEVSVREEISAASSCR